MGSAETPLRYDERVIEMRIEAIRLNERVQQLQNARDAFDAAVAAFSPRTASNDEQAAWWEGLDAEVRRRTATLRAVS